ncbi:MAG: hypothetical protein R3C16_03805 [Hyphomonadaceae bacterium]
MTAPTRRRSWRTYALIAVAVIAAALVLAPSAVAAQLGSLIGGLWVSTMSAVLGILGAR